MSAEFRTLKPVYGVNYDKGFIGFTYRPGDIVSCGIAYFTRFDRLSDIKVSHVFIVTGEDECVEALGSGVTRSDLRHYFEDPNVQVFFRQPRGWTPEMGEQLAAEAYKYVGKKYGYGLIAANALANSALGRALNALSFGGTDKFLFWALDGKGSQICSEVIARVMQAVMGPIGILRQKANRINPQPLFEDDGVFELWKVPGKQQPTTN